MRSIDIDVGGTFTDLVIFDEVSSELLYLKFPTRPREAWLSVISALEASGLSIDHIDIIVHASTLGTNIFFGQKGLELPKGLLITNEGFRDIIEIGRQNRPSLYDPYFSKPRPLISRNMRIGIRGRIDAFGKEVEPLDVKILENIVREYCGKVDVFIISFLHSYINPVHEETARRIIETYCPGADVVLSHIVDPEPMEYERTSTTVVNALLKPVLAKYLYILRRELLKRGFHGKILVMKSSGGVSTVEYALETPAAFIESGPAAGAIATAYFSKIMDLDRVIALDMGGTTAKASAIIDGEPLIVKEYEVGGEIHMGRLIKGSGYPVRIPHIDIVEVSAGGGSIAWIDHGGSIRVGPLSAGSEPGPACYGRGGVEPTVTDANLVLGRLPTVLAGGRIRLYKELAEKAIDKLAQELGLSIEETALSIIRIANTLMARALRIVSIERGLDPREFIIFGFGGAGPLHIAYLARELSVKKAIVPPMPGVFSALGLLLTDYRHDYRKGIMKHVSEIDNEMIEDIFRELEEKALNTLYSEGFSMDNIRIIRELDMRYSKQAYELSIPYVRPFSKTVELFHEVHEAKYGYRHEDEEVIIVAAKLTAYGITKKPPVIRKYMAKPYTPRPDLFRKVYFEEIGWINTPIYYWEKLYPGAHIDGPAIIESIDTTILIPPGYNGIINEFKAIVVEV